MGSGIDESLLIAMFVDSFGPRKDSDHGGAISALLTLENLSWSQVSLRLLREFESNRTKPGNESTRKNSEQEFKADG